MNTLLKANAVTAWQGFRDKVLYVVLAGVLSAVILYLIPGNKSAREIQVVNNGKQTTIIYPPNLKDENNKSEKAIASDSVHNEPALTPATKLDSTAIITGENKKPVLQLQLVDPAKLPAPSPNTPVLKLVTQISNATDPNGLSSYYGLDLKLSGTPVVYTIGAPSISRYFKLKGSRHKGMFIISNRPGLYYTGDTAVHGQDCNFYKIYAVYGSGWSDEIKPSCAGKFFTLYSRLKVYPCDGNILYKVGASKVEQADEYKFPIN